MKITIGEEDFEATMGVGTLVAYEEEFGRDLIQDVFGKVKVEDPKKAEEDGLVMVLDYTQTEWTALLRVAWAAIRTADPSLPGFKEWAAGVGEVNFNTISGQVIPAAMRQFFRPKDEQGE